MEGTVGYVVDERGQPPGRVVGADVAGLGVASGKGHQMRIVRFAGRQRVQNAVPCDAGSFVQDRVDQVDNVAGSAEVAAPLHPGDPIADPRHGGGFLLLVGCRSRVGDTRLVVGVGVPTVGVREGSGVVVVNSGGWQLGVAAVGGVASANRGEVAGVGLIPIRVVTATAVVVVVVVGSRGATGRRLAAQRR